MASKIQIWLSKGTDRFRFPVVPESFSVSGSAGYEDIDVMQLGEITRFGNMKQQDVSFSAFFPKLYHPSYVEYTDIPAPYEALNKLLNWMNTKQEVQLVIVGTNVNFPVTIRDIEYSEEGGSPGDIQFDIKLKQYRKTAPRVYDPNKTNPSRPGSPDSGLVNGKYTVKKGDSLWIIAQRLLGSSSKWSVIYEANKALIGSNPHKIYVGQVLVIPGFGSTSPTPPTSSKTFTIRDGDTFFEIAAAFTNTTVSSLQALNPNIRPNAMRVGAVLKLSANAVKLRDPKRLSSGSSSGSSKNPISKPSAPKPRYTTSPKPSAPALYRWVNGRRFPYSSPTKYYPGRQDLP